MILTKDHLQFYREHKVPAPYWGLEASRVSVHTLINAQVQWPKPKRHRTEPNNLLYLIRMVKAHKQETVKEFLKRLSNNPSGTDPKRRTGYARKWYARLTK